MFVIDTQFVFTGLKAIEELGNNMKVGHISVTYVFMCYWLGRGQYRLINARTAQPWGSVLSTVLTKVAVNNTFITCIHVTARLAHTSTCTQELNKIMIKIILQMHLRFWSSSNVKYRGISRSIRPLSGQYMNLWTALGERGLVSGIDTITWHVIMDGTWSITHTCRPVLYRLHPHLAAN